MKIVRDIVSLIVVSVIVVAAFFVLLRSCSSDERAGGTFVPVDSTFAPVKVRHYRPASTPFERHSKPPARLPKGVKESDVARAIVVVKSDSSGRRDTTMAIETKTGEVFVDNQNGSIKSVDVINFLPPVVEAGIFWQAGVTVSIADALRPSIGVAVLQFYGKCQFPVFIVDTQGVSGGVAWREHDISFGLLGHWSFVRTERQIKFSLMYNF